MKLIWFIFWLCNGFPVTIDWGLWFVVAAILDG